MYLLICIYIFFISLYLMVCMARSQAYDYRGSSIELPTRKGAINPFVYKPVKLSLRPSDKKIKGI